MTSSVSYSDAAAIFGLSSDRRRGKNGGRQVMVSKALLRDFSFVEDFEIGCTFSVGIKLENTIIMTYFYL